MPRNPDMNGSVASRGLSLPKKSCWMAASCLIVSLLVSSTGGRIQAAKNLNNAPVTSTGGLEAQPPLPTSGDLIWYRHNEWFNGSSNWANRGAGITVKSGFQDFKFVFATSNGAIYGVRQNGDLMWFQHDGRREGNMNWANGGTGIRVGVGWHGFKSVFATSHGVIYGIRPNGDLMWYRHVGFNTGRNQWANGGEGKRVGRGWQFFKFVFAIQANVPTLPNSARSVGIIYGVRPEGDLLWYEHEGWLNGDNDWEDRGRIRSVGPGWSGFTSVFAAPNGIIYGVEPDGDLQWYAHFRNPKWCSLVGKPR